ncbi:MAG: minor capsid protein [Selenomonadaceae bacterium]|nr:minor capsid protein [Selenomonadaceae bacterium]
METIITSADFNRELISGLSEESRHAVMNIILRGQALAEDPRRLAQEIRPLIGLNQRQAQANVTYRERVYQRFIERGLSPSKAAEKSDAAALRYAGKQHRYRAETIVNTEMAFAYNRGAHMSVGQAIANGYMGKCEMVWTTAGTNRVCSRCMELRGRVVGTTEDSGVTIPPLHPRCRCTIIYQEIAPAKALRPKPQITIVNYEDVAVIRSQKEFLMFANQMKPVIEQYTGRQSKWNGRIILKDRGDAISGKCWDCSIVLNPNAPDHAVIHELVHSCSISYYNVMMFLNNKFEEELSVEYLSQELAILKNVPVVKSDYNPGVELIREFKAMLGVEKTDIEFASELIKQPLGERWDWLWEQISDKINPGTSLELGQQLMEKLEKIRQWVI